MPRTLGASKVPKEKKAVILAKKNTGLYGNKKIAKDAGVSVVTVEKITNNSVDAEVKTLADRYGAEIVGKMKNVAMLALNNTLKKMDEMSPKDSATVTGIMIDKIQLLENKPTSITKTLTDNDYAQQLFKQLTEKFNWSPERAAKGVGELYPGVDVNGLGGGE